MGGWLEGWVGERAFEFQSQPSVFVHWASLSRRRRVLEGIPSHPNEKAMPSSCAACMLPTLHRLIN
jgi:hypothetical protein